MQTATQESVAAIKEIGATIERISTIARQNAAGTVAASAATAGAGSSLSGIGGTGMVVSMARVVPRS